MSSFDPGARLLLLARVGPGEVITQQDGGHIPTILIDLLTSSVQGNGDRREESSSWVPHKPTRRRRWRRGGRRSAWRVLVRG